MGFGLFSGDTLPKFIMEPKNHGFQKESPSLAVPFSGSMLNFAKVSPENGWFPIGISFWGRSIFRGELLVSFKEGTHHTIPKNLSQLSCNKKHLTPGEDIWT